MRVAAVLLAVWALGGAPLPAHADPAETDPDLAAADQDYAAIATPLKDDDRARAWAEIKAAYPFFADHETKAAGREIPVVALTAAG